VVAFAAVEADTGALSWVSQDVVEHFFSVARGQMAKDAGDQDAGYAQVASGSAEGGVEPIKYVVERDIAIGVGLGVEEHFDVADPFLMNPTQVGSGELFEVGGVPEDRGPQVVEVQEALEVVEFVGAANVVDGLLWQGHPVALSKSEHEFGFKSAFEVKV
jgi:hypothetical protein